MTTLAVYVDDDRVWLGADSLMTRGGMRANLREQKWFADPRDNRWMIGGCGSPKTTDLAFEAMKKNANPLKLAATIRDEMLRIGWVPDAENGTTPYFDSHFFVVTDGKAFHVEPGCEYTREIGLHDFLAIGTGSHFAEGAWAALQGVRGMEPNLAMKLTIDAAIKLDVYSGGQTSVQWFR